jgi:cellulose binding protein with CBM2 domain
VLRIRKFWSCTVNTSKGIRAAALWVAFLGASQVSVGQAPSSCGIAYSVASQWSNGFQGDVKITNGSTALTSWTLSWTFSSGQTISQLWNGVVTQAGAKVTVNNASYNANVGAGGTVDVGFLASITGTNGAPTAFALNGVACTGDGGAPPPPPPPPPTSPIALGLNTAAWDGEYTGTAVATVNGFLSQAHVGLLRFPGGSWADLYAWSQNTDISQCISNPNNPCTPATDAINFDTFAADAAQAGAATFITVNYGSGTPQLAAAWVAHAHATAGEAVALWEVGNENYGCWEANSWLAGSPALVHGYVPNGSVCPNTQVMANSYAANALPFMTAMKQADSTARIGVPWAFEPSEAAGAGVVNSSQWNDTVLNALGANVAFVDAHWYPFSNIVGLTDTQILASVAQIPTSMQRIRTTLQQHNLAAGVVVGETNISNQATPLDFQPVAALFAAGTSLGWLSQGALSVDLWDMHNFGSPQSGDFGMFTSTTPTPSNTPLPSYYGYLLASRLTRSAAAVSSLTTGSNAVLGFTSGKAGGSQAVLLINTNTSQSATVRVDVFPAGSALQTSTYSASSSSSSNPVVQGTTTAQQVSSGVVLPPESIVVVGTAN